jgi:hypothetical protein
MHLLLHGTDPLLRPTSTTIRYLYRLKQLTMSLSKPSYEAATIGSEKDALQVQILRFPRTDASLLEKVQAFAYFEEVIRQHRSQLSSVAVQQAYANNVPVSSSAAASEEANRICCDLYNSFFHVENLSCLGFYHSSGRPALMDLDPNDRKSDILYVQFEATVAPGNFSDTLAKVASSSVTFFLKLPQSAASCKPSANADELPAA